MGSTAFCIQNWQGLQVSSESEESFQALAPAGPTPPSPSLGNDLSGHLSPSWASLAHGNTEQHVCHLPSAASPCRCQATRHHVSASRPEAELQRRPPESRPQPRPPALSAGSSAPGSFPRALRPAATAQRRRERRQGCG